MCECAHCREGYELAVTRELLFFSHCLAAQARLELQADFETFVTKLEKHFNTEELHLQSGASAARLLCVLH